LALFLSPLSKGRELSMSSPLSQMRRLKI